MAVGTLVLIEQFEIRDNSITHKPTGWRFTAYQDRPTDGTVIRGRLGDELETGEDFPSARGRRDGQEALGAASRSEKKTALTLDHSAGLGQERALRADPWSIIDSVAAEITLHGKSADVR